MADLPNDGWTLDERGGLTISPITHRGSPLWGDATHVVHQPGELVPVIIHEDGTIERWRGTGRPTNG